MMNARWTSTSASRASASTASASSTSPWRYSVFCSPSEAGSNGRRAMPRMRACGSSAFRNARPISPVGPVTATVRSLIVEDDARRLAVALDARLDGLDLVGAGPCHEVVDGLEAGDVLEVLDRREDEQELARLGALQRARRLEPARVDDLGAVDLDLRALGRLGQEEPGVEADRDLGRRDPARE